MANQSSHRIEICVLGPLTAARRAEPIDLGGPKPRTVVAVLAAHVGRTVPTDLLIEAVYGPAARPNARRSLQTFVAGLRRAFGDAVQRQGDGYRLDPAAVSLDAAEAQALYDSAQGASDADDVATTLRLAESLWRGRAFEDVDGHTILDAEITRLEELRLLILEMRLDADLAAGRHLEAVGELEALAVAHPFRERFTCQLMVALYRAQRQAEALRAYRRLRNCLVEELGIDPSETTQRLEQRIIDQDPLLLEFGTPQGRTGMDFEVGGLIGEGRFAKVYRARQASVGREVAVKVIRPEYAHNPEFLRRFDSEARIVARLEHPHIVPIYEYWRDPDGAYLAMRLLRGGTVADALSLGRWAPDRVVRLIGQVAAAAAAAHRAGIIHRDIKPGNILLDEEGNGYLSDFGIAKIVGSVTTTTADPSPATPAYTAPEILRDQPPQPATDVYALGLVTHELLTGRHPFDVDSMPAMIAHQLNEPVPSLRSRHVTLPAEVDEVLARATAKNPASRFADPVEFADALAQAAGLGVPVPSGNGGSALPQEQAPRVEDFITHETPFGPIAMDEISNRAVYDALYERDNRIHAEIVRRRPSFIVGRRGAGKTALMRAPLLDPTNLLVEFKSADLFAEVLQCIEAIEANGGRLFVKQVGDIWDGVVWSGLCLAVLETTTAPDETRADLFALQRYVAGLGDTATMDVDHAGAAFCRGKAAAATNEPANPSAVSIADAKSACQRILRHRGLRPVVLIDSMEDLHTEFAALLRPLGGLFGLIGRADRAAAPECDFRFCYPSELWMMLSDFAANPLKDAENHITIAWHAKELLKIAGHRLALYLGLHHPTTLSEVLGRKAYNSKSLDDARTVLGAVLPSKVRNVFGIAEDTLAYVMRHTQLLPRHLLRILNDIMLRNREAGGEPTSVSPAAVVEGVHRVEELLAMEIFSAYSAVHPWAREACRRALPELGVSFRDGDLHRTFNRTGIAKTTGLEYFEFKEMLIEIGALGRVMDVTDRYVEAEFDYTLPNPLFPGHHDALCVHPLFSRVFQSRVGGDGETAGRAVYPYGSDPVHPEAPMS